MSSILLPRGMGQSPEYRVYRHKKPKTMLGQKTEHILRFKNEGRGTEYRITNVLNTNAEGRGQSPEYRVHA